MENYLILTIAALIIFILISFISYKITKWMHRRYVPIKVLEEMERKREKDVPVNHRFIAHINKYYNPYFIFGFIDMRIINDEIITTGIIQLSISDRPTDTDISEILIGELEHFSDEYMCVSDIPDVEYLDIINILAFYHTKNKNGELNTCTSAILRINTDNNEIIFTLPNNLDEDVVRHDFIINHKIHI